MLTIHLAPLYYRVPVTNNGQLTGTGVSLERYLFRFNHRVWNHQQRRMVLVKRYVFYNDITKMLSLPRYDFAEFCRFLQHHNIPYTTEPVALQYGLPMDISLKSGVQPREERQVQAINHLVNNEECLRGLALSTGLGKTFCAITSISQLGVRAMICMAGLLEQWKDALLQFTTLYEDEIYVIQGEASLAKLLAGIDRTIRPKVILCSIRTISKYALNHENYRGYPHFEALFDLLRIGVRVVDEAHLNFWANLMMDLRTNAAINIMLTATFDRSEQQVKQIFDAHYPRLMRFGEGQYDRYIDVFSYSYALGGTIKPRSYSTQQGYSHVIYEEWLLRKLEKLDTIYTLVYSPAIYSHYINVRRPGDKLLILCARIDMCKWFKQRLEQELPKAENFTIVTHTYGDSDEQLKTADIIISTPGSAGTGTDIKNLRVMLMTIATGNDTMNKQTMGRLRVLPDGTTPHYIYVWNRDLQAHQRYQDARRILFTARSRQFREYHI